MLQRVPDQPSTSERERAIPPVISPQNAADSWDVPNNGTYVVGRNVPACSAMEAQALQDSEQTRPQLVGANIRGRRLAAGLTQQRLADQLGIPRIKVVGWENGYHEPKPARLEKIALLLDCKWTDLYDNPPYVA